MVQTSQDPYAVKLIHAHAINVDNFVKHGMDIISEPHEAPAK